MHHGSRASRVRPAVAVLGVAALLAAAGCSKSENNNSGASDNSSAGAQQVQSASAPPSGSGCTIGQLGYPKVDLKTAKVGFSQSEKEDNPFRIAETTSIKDEAKAQGIANLTTTNAQSQFNKQISDVQQMISDGVQLLVIAPLNSDGWDSVFAQAKAKKIPIVTIDRKINAAPCTDYLTFIGSNFTEQGKRAADQMAKAMNNKGKLAILLGASGNNVTTQRTQGFLDEIKIKAPNIQIVAQQTGDFDLQKGQTVTEQLLQSHSDLNGIYAENDQMGLGAVNALKGAGKKAGDVKLVSIDGTRNAVQGIVGGWFNAVIESNPRFGPLAFKTLSDFEAGTAIPENIIISDKEYDSANAKDSVAGAY